MIQKILLLSLFIIIGVIALVPTMGLAQVTIENPIASNTFGELIKAIHSFIFNLAIVVAPLMIIIGGFVFITSSGDPKKIKQGSDIIMYTLIGFAIILLSGAIVSAIEGVLQGE